MGFQQLELAVLKSFAEAFFAQLRGGGGGVYVDDADLAFGHAGFCQFSKQGLARQLAGDDRFSSPIVTLDAGDEASVNIRAARAEIGQ